MRYVSLVLDCLLQDYKNGDWFEGMWRYDRWWDSQKSDCKLTAPNIQGFRDANINLEDMDRGLAFVGQWMYGKMHGLGKIQLYGGKEKFTGLSLPFLFVSGDVSACMSDFSSLT